jgi:hypothetical protein
MLGFCGSEMMIFYYPFYNYHCYAKVSTAFKDRVLGSGGILWVSIARLMPILWLSGFYPDFPFGYPDSG